MFFALRGRGARPSSLPKSFYHKQTSEAQKHEKTHPQNTLKRTAGKAVCAGKSFYSSCASKVLLVLGRNASSKHTSLNSSTSSLPPSVVSITSRSSSDSTAPTEYSLPHPDCGAPFHVSNFSNTSSDPEEESCQLTSPNKLATLPDDTQAFLEPPAPETHPDIESQAFRKCSTTGKLLRMRLAAKCKKMLFISPGKALEHDGIMQHLNQPLQQNAHPAVSHSNHHRGGQTMPEDDESSGDAELNEHNEETDNVSDDDGDDDDDDDEVGRCDFATIGAITDTQFCTVVDLHCKTIGTNDQTRVINRTHGTYNYVASVDVSNEHGRAQYVVRVPGHGTKDHWQEEDAYTLEREVDMLKILSSRTSAPVSKVLAYSTSHDNALGFPFILMTRLPGKDAYSIWFDQPYQGNIEAACTADVPSIATERKRTTFLRSLAKVMTEIQSISFPGIGMPKYDEPEDVISVDHSFHWTNDTDDTFYNREASNSTQDYIQKILKHKFQPKVFQNMDQFCRQYGTYLILDEIFSQPVFNSPGEETFTVHHNDLDLQNILVDTEGNVTGIIDWDNSYVSPRCTGAAAVPMFLRGDWFPYYANSLDNSPHMIFNYQHYREVYAAAMIEAGNITDAKYTMKSALYQAALAAITEGGDATDLISRILNEIPNCRVNVKDFKFAIARGWPAAQVILSSYLPEIFEPELPRHGFLADAENDLEIREWMIGFDDFTMEEIESAPHNTSESVEAGTAGW